MNDRGFIVICYLSDGRDVWFLRYVELFVGVDLVGDDERYRSVVCCV